MMAFWPQITKGHTIQMSPIVYKPFGLDNDGDQMNYHVPASDEAAAEAAAKMLPSKNLFSAAAFRKPLYVPTQEYLGGLHAATSRIDNKKRTRVFATKKDFMTAFYAGQVDPDQKVEIVQK